MKKTLAALTLALLLSLVAAVGVANATHSENEDFDGPPKDFAVGSATLLEYVVSSKKADLSFAAYSGPLGEDPRGHINPRIEPFAEATSHVTCLGVLGNRAAVAGEVEESSPGRVRGVAIFAEDNGKPSEQTPDRAGVVRFFALKNTDVCPVLLGLVSSGFSLFPVEQGNVTVHDGQPNPQGPSAAEAEALTKEEALEQLKEQGIEIQVLGTE